MNDVNIKLHYEHAFDIRLNFHHRRALGPVSGGARHGYTSIGAGSVVRGPLLNGKVLDYSGADWPVIRTDGVVELNAHYMIEADDGALIYIRNLGYVHGPLVIPDPHSGEPATVNAYFRCTPYFRAPEGQHGWLNRTVVIGVGTRVPRQEGDDAPDHSMFRYFRVL